jgi:hypothetical protein
MDIKQEPVGNIKPVKPDRKKAGKRIDGIVALIMAVDRVVRNKIPLGLQCARDHCHLI